MPPRATPLAPEDRRTAILTALIPLLVEKGGDVTTKEIAKAAGIAEGTIFRVFPDKATLLFAAAEEAINPAGGQEDVRGRGGRGRLTCARRSSSPRRGCSTGCG